MIKLAIHITVFAHFFSPDLYISSLDSNSLKGASSMEEHLLYKQEVGGSIPSCPDIHMEWQRSIFGDEALLTITNELMVTFFDPHQNMKW